jgi:hypothetical protein
MAGVLGDFRRDAAWLMDSPISDSASSSVNLLRAEGRSSASSEVSSDISGELRAVMIARFVLSPGAPAAGAAGTAEGPSLLPFTIIVTRIVCPAGGQLGCRAMKELVAELCHDKTLSASGK